MKYHISEVTISADNPSPLRLSLAPGRDFLVLSQDRAEVEINPDELDIIAAQGKMLLKQFQETQPVSSENDEELWDAYFNAENAHEGTIAQLRSVYKLGQDSVKAMAKTEEVIEDPQWHLLSDREPQHVDRCIYRFHPAMILKYGVWYSTRNGFWTPGEGMVFVNPYLVTWRLALPHEIPLNQLIKDIAEDAHSTGVCSPPPAPAGVQRRYPSPATIAECGGPCDSQGPEACDCGLLQELNPSSPKPASGLVELVAKALAEVNGLLAPEVWKSDACVVIRVIAAWLRNETTDSELISRAIADRLDQEAGR